MNSSPLKSQVVSLELSKRLKELGVPQKSLFYWIEYDENDWRLAYEGEMDDFFKGKGPDWIHEALLRNDGRIFSAFLVGELGEMLKKAGPELTIKAYGDLHGFKGTGAVGSIGVLWLLTEPDRLTKMLIYLLKNNLLKASDL